MPSMSQLLSVIATADNDIFHRLYIGLLQPHDETLRQKGGTYGLRIYEEIERDAHAYSVLNKRKLAPLAYEWDLEPASSSRKDKKAADMVKRHLETMGVNKLCFAMGDANLKGYNVDEILWKRDGAELVPFEFRTIDQRRIKFMASTDNPGGWNVRLLTWEEPLKGIEVPDRKFMVHTFGSLDGNPYGIGLGQKLYWPAWFKRNLSQFWLQHSEKFASPTIAGGYPAGFSETDQDKLLQRLIDIKALGAVVFPEGMDIKALTQGTSGDAYERAVRYWDEEISKAVLGETLTTTMGDVGSYAASKTHNDVRLELAQVDANDHGDTLNKQLIRWDVDLNCPGAGYPKFVRHVEEPADLKNQADTDTLLFAMGYRLDAEHVEEKYGPGYVDEQEEELPKEPSVDGIRLPSPVLDANGQPLTPTPGQPGAPGGKPAPAGARPASGAPAQAVAFAAGDPAQGPVDAITERALANLDMGEFLLPVRRMVAKAKSLDDLRQQLDRAYPELHSSAFADVMAQAFTVAALTGRHEVLQTAGVTAKPRRPGGRR